MSTRQSLLNDLSLDRALKHLEFLVNEVGERLGGTEEIRQAAQYILNELKSYGLEAKIDHFDIYQSYPIAAELRVLYPETKSIQTKPACHIASTLPEGLEGELVYVGVGDYADYEGKQVAGKIVLTDMTWSPPRPEKARIAFELGAKALIIMNWGPTDNAVIQMGGVKSQWGNPTPESFSRMPQLPVISITRAAGEYLTDLCKRGDVRVWLRAEATREWVTSNQPVAFLRIPGPGDEFVLIGTHLEAWGKTAICNSSGNSLTLELARVLAKHRHNLQRGVVFAFWDGHEIAEAAGSTWFVDNYWDDLMKNCVAYINIDNPGIRGTSIPGLTSVREMKRFLFDHVAKTWNTNAEWHEAYKGGDASFFGIGIPYVSFYTRYSSEELSKLRYASLSPWLHSEADTIDKIDKTLYAEHLRFFTSLVWELCNMPILPYDFVPVADQMEEGLQALSKMAPEDVGPRLLSLTAKVTRFRKAMKDLNEQESDPHVSKEGVSIINAALMQVCRQISPVWRSEAGRYGHDPYGYVFATKPFPRLYHSLFRMLQLRPDTQSLKLWKTELLRERNRVADTLENVTNLGKGALQKLKRTKERR